MNQTLGQRVAEAIETADVEVAEVAKAADISPQAVYQWINGQSTSLKGPSLAALAEITGFSARWILKGQGPKRTGYSRGSKRAALLTLMQDMNDYQVEVLLKTAEALLHDPAEHR